MDIRMERLPGEIVERNDIHSSLAPFRVAPEYKIKYPVGLLRALARLYVEYNEAFSSLVAINREWESDYRHIADRNGRVLNFAVQIDMAAADTEFLRATDTMPEDDLLSELRKRIFEIDNSLAMYQLLERLFPSSGWRTALDSLRKQLGRPIAVLAVTEQKYHDMLASEFGKNAEEVLSDDEVLRLSGFNAFWGPQRFLEHLNEHRGECAYLLYARASDPIQKLRRPEECVEHPLLGDSTLRRVIKANSLTLNIDNPDWAIGDPRRINDTKCYLPAIGTAFRIDGHVFTSNFEQHLRARRPYIDFPGVRLSSEFTQGLISLGLDPAAVESGRQMLRYKPAQGSYGCYGHVRGVLTDYNVRRALRRELLRRGAYVVQPERDPLLVADQRDRTLMAVDKVFLAYLDGHPAFIGGFRTLLPADSKDARKGRNHGTGPTIWAEIVCKSSNRDHPVRSGSSRA
jgi:hypothetical protein